MAWYEFREGPLTKYGGYLLVGTIVALLLFYLLRGRIRVEGELSGRTVTRFKAIERFAHWLLGGLVYPFGCDRSFRADGPDLHCALPREGI